MIELKPFQICPFSKENCMHANMHVVDPGFRGLCHGLDPKRGTPFVCEIHPVLKEGVKVINIYEHFGAKNK